jgi:energy-coupling factor transporter ATP-binding protein EcfA2
MSPLPDSESASTDEPAIEVCNVTFHYPDGNVALRGVSFSVRPGESVGIVGPNGAGKSTLLLHLNGLLPSRTRYEHHHHHHEHLVHSHHDQGQVRIGGLAVADKHLAEIRRRVGLLFQDPDDQLFCPTVGEDVAFGPKNQGLGREALRAIVAESLAAVGLIGYEHRIAHHLSYGERKRVCLAGVLACRPVILALDEPSGNLDPASRRQFIELLRQLPITKVIATHDLELVLELCDRVILLDRGEIHADGPSREILADAALMKEHRLEVPLSLRGRHTPAI